jgi:uncharacterized protein YhbP (UPF0306 family)
LDDETITQVRSIIEANRYMTLGTAYGGVPWVAPVAYVVDHTCAFYWTSRRDARHSRSIQRNPEAAIAIFDSTAVYGEVDGVQAEGLAEALPDEQVTESWALYVSRYPMFRSYSSDVVLSTSPIGIYRFTPRALYKHDSASTDGDRRLQVDLEALQSRPPRTQ